MTSLHPEARDRVYAECARAISEAGPERESLFLARLVADLAQALDGLPTPSLSA